MDEPAAGRRRAPHLSRRLRCTPCARIEPEGSASSAIKPLQRPGKAAPARVVDIGPILGDMDVDDRPEFARQRAGLADGLVGNGEARVQPDEAAHQRRRGDAPACFEPAPRLLAAEIALARAVAEQRPDAEVAQASARIGSEPSIRFGDS